MYDSLLYGYGLTIALLGSIKTNTTSERKEIDYLNFNTFIRDFVFAKDHARIMRNYYNLLDFRNEETDRTLTKVKQRIIDDIGSIESMGFERWVGKHLFKKESSVDAETKLLTYILYNYWFHIIQSEVLLQQENESIASSMAQQILGKMNSDPIIMTTNFDTAFDKYLSPEHVHGRFSLPLSKAKEIVLMFLNEIEFEYKFLFGTSGFEKLSRLDRIKSIRNTTYDLDFFYSESIHYGNMLIYGMSFGQSEVVDQDLLGKYKEIKDSYLLDSVDGHILLKLDLLREQNRLSKVTFAYYSETDYIYLTNLIGKTNLSQVCEFKQCSEIVTF